ncbi:hypothetical protein QBC39DRAFT_365819 [Podospora conica]|nr:hypothetical protein QBC39DRAFT_365819 [Schizothecium conicum]
MGRVSRSLCVSLCRTASRRSCNVEGRWSRQGLPGTEIKPPAMPRLRGDNETRDPGWGPDVYTSPLLRKRRNRVNDLCNNQGTGRPSIMNQFVGEKDLPRTVLARKYPAGRRSGQTDGALRRDLWGPCGSLGRRYRPPNLPAASGNHQPTKRGTARADADTLFVAVAGVYGSNPGCTYLSVGLRNLILTASYSRPLPAFPPRPPRSSPCHRPCVSARLPGEEALGVCRWEHPRPFLHFHRYSGPTYLHTRQHPSPSSFCSTALPSRIDHARVTNGELSQVQMLRLRSSCRVS